jgi:3-oxoadipate enol-lactonase
VISFDYRGSGVSSEDPGWPTTRSLAQDALAVLSALSIDRAHVFGISLGGMTASWLAIKEPPRVVRLCLASAPARGIELSHAGMRRGAKMAVCFAKPDIDVEASLVDRVLSHAFRREHPDEVRRIEATVREHPASRTALLKHARAGALHDVSREVCVLRTPTLVLAGDHDSLLGTEAPRELAAAMPAAQFEVMQGTGHDLTLEQPVATAERVARFFREAP